MSWQIGRALVDRVEEQCITVPVALLTSDREFIASRLEPLPPGMFDGAAQTFPLCFQSWVIRVDDRVVVVDPCNGNGRVRPGFARFEQLDVPWLERLAAAGVRPEAVDMVFCTHMHCDHCGWNTRLEDGRYIPTFPNATYLFVAREYDRWDPDAPPGSEPRDDAPYNAFVFAEAIRPVVEHGLARLIDTPFQLSPSLRIEAAPGHTIGHAVLHLDSDGARACFSGDVAHHPAQVFDARLRLPGCDDLPQAIATRRDLFARLARDRSLIFPAHFGPPHHGRVVEEPGGFRFVPGGARVDIQEDRLP